MHRPTSDSSNDPIAKMEILLASHQRDLPGNLHDALVAAFEEIKQNNSDQVIEMAAEVAFLRATTQRLAFERNAYSTYLREIFLKCKDDGLIQFNPYFRRILSFVEETKRHQAPTLEDVRPKAAKSLTKNNPAQTSTGGRFSLN